MAANEQKVNILATGVTGYIGGSVIAKFLAGPKAGKLNITTVTRSEEKAKKFKSLGINAIVVSHNDHKVMRKLASEADIVIAMADVDDEEAAKVTLAGLKDRFDATGQRSIFINTSGTGTLVDNAMGKFTYDTVYDDSDPDQIETLPPTQLHRNVDLRVIEADKEGYIYSYLILPSTIYGIAKHKLAGVGLSNPHSQQIPLLIKAGIKRGQAGVVGEGRNTWNNVHIDDLTDLYVRLYDGISAGTVAHGREGYFFGENGQHKLYDLSKAVAVALSSHGIGTEEPTPFNDEELKELAYLGTNSRAKGTRARATGWDPIYTTKDMLASVKTEVEVILAQEKSQGKA